jgi:hypothetical protein
VVRVSLFRDGSFTKSLGRASCGGRGVSLYQPTDGTGMSARLELLLQNTSDRSLGCPTFRVDHHCDLHHPIIFSSRQFVARLLVQGRFRWPGQLFGTVCPLTLRRLTVCQFFVIVLKIICSHIRIQALFNNCTSSIVA